MKKNTITNFEKIREKRTLSKENQKAIFGRLISNFAIGVSFIILMLSYYLATFYISKNITEVIYHVSASILLIVTITIFEIGYKKDDGKYALIGLEILIFALISLFAPYIYYVFNKITIISCILLMTVYYIIKIIVIYNKEKNLALKINDDIDTIIKKESQDNMAKKASKSRTEKAVAARAKRKVTATKKEGKEIAKTKTKSATKKQNLASKAKEDLAANPAKPSTKATTKKETDTVKKKPSSTSNKTKNTPAKKATSKKVEKTSIEDTKSESKQKPTTKKTNTTKTSTTKKSSTTTTAKKAPAKPATKRTNTTSKSTTKKSGTTNKRTTKKENK